MGGRLPDAEFSRSKLEAADVVDDVVSALGVVGILALPNAFHLEVQEESFGDRSVPARVN